MAIEMTVPQTGESITEVQIAEWLKSEGDIVQQDEAVVEIETDKASMELPSPASGKISKILKHNGDTVGVGEVIAYIEGDGAAPPKVATAKDTTKAAAPAPSKEAPPAKQPQAAAPEPPKKPATESPPKAAVPEPPKEGPPHEKPSSKAAEAPQEEPPAEQPPAKTDTPPAQEAIEFAPKPPASQPSREEEAVPMTMLRRRIGERLVAAQHNAALLTTFNEVDMSAVVGLRQRFEKQFQERHGTKLGFMSFFVKASVAALVRIPQLNADIRDQNIVYHKYYDIGVAVSTERGLVVPVLRNAERMSFAQIEQAIADLAARARDNKLKLDELQGGTFTITNGGIFGSLLSTPIVNPPQSGVLGLHTIQDRPVARDGQVVIRPMMYIALTYDHRIVDGREAVTFLRHIKELIEEPARMLIES